MNRVVQELERKTNPKTEFEPYKHTILMSNVQATIILIAHVKHHLIRFLLLEIDYSV